MPQRKDPAKKSPPHAQVEQRAKAGVEPPGLSLILQNARLRLPPKEEIEVLQMEKLQMEVARLRAADRGRSERPQQDSFVHSEDYRSVRLNGITYTLTGRQAQIIEILHEAHQNGTPEVGSASILEKLGTSNGRWQDTFKSSPDARNALIASGTRRGTLRLNIKK